jgi:hypothetical protein
MLVVGYLALLRDQFAADGYLDAADILGDLVELGDAHITNFR